MRLTVGQLRDLIRETIVYHGSHESDLSEVIPDPHGRKVLSSLGTWFTSSPEHTKNYGDNTYEVELPDDAKFLEAHTDDFEEFFWDVDVAEKTVKSHKDFYLMKRVMLWRQTGRIPLEWRAKKKPTGLVLTDLMDVEKDRARSAMNKQVFRNWDYLQAWRAKKQAEGYRGIVWHNSTIDTTDDNRHDVYLVFPGTTTPVKRKL